MKKKKKKEVLLNKLNAAKSDVSDAEKQLEVLLAEMSVLPRAEKRTVTLVIELAFSKLSSARTDLADLEELISSSKVE